MLKVKFSLSFVLTIKTTLFMDTAAISHQYIYIYINSRLIASIQPLYGQTIW